jgi:hypothetical protein
VVEHVPPVHDWMQLPLVQSPIVHDVELVHVWWQSPPGHVSTHVSPVVHV